MKEEKDPAILEAFLSLVLLLFLCYNPCFPFAYKRESKVPLPRGSDQEIKNTRARHKHMAK